MAICDATKSSGHRHTELVTAAAFIAVLLTASQRWAADRGAVPLRALVDQAVTTVEPLLAALEHSARSQD